MVTVQTREKTHQIHYDTPGIKTNTHRPVATCWQWIGTVELNAHLIVSMGTRMGFLLNSSITGLNLEMIEVINKRLQYFCTATCLHSARCQQLLTFSSVSTTAYIQLGVNNCLHSARSQQVFTFSSVSTTAYIKLGVNNCLHSARCQQLFTFSSVSTSVNIQLGVNNCLHSAQYQQLFTFSLVSTTVYIQLGVNKCLCIFSYKQLVLID